MKLYVRKTKEYADADTLLLEDERRRKLARIRNENARAQSIAAGMLLREALADYGLPVGDQPLSLVYGENGKPELPGGEGPYFSISHSGTLVVCAVDDAPIGVDVQIVRKISKRIANKILTECELREFAVLPEESADRYLTVRWTEKESIAKLLGRGLTIDFRSLQASDYNLHTLMRTVGCEEYVITVAGFRK